MKLVSLVVLAALIFVSVFAQVDLCPAAGVEETCIVELDVCNMGGTAPATGGIGSPYIYQTTLLFIAPEGIAANPVLDPLAHASMQPSPIERPPRA